jgi:Beta-galactosidase
MLQDANLFDLRYPVPWHRIEAEQGCFDWRWMDGPMTRLYELGFKPILDPLHHVSFPEWLQDGFRNPLFPEFYLRFIENVARRYEWVDRYTILNEPLPTLVLCALTGDWYPYLRSDADFVRMTIHVGRAVCSASHRLRALNSKVELFHIDSCEHHCALDVESETWVRHANDRRFLFHDLILGRIDKTHPLLPYLQRGGLLDRERCWFDDNRAEIDVLGLDYYAHSEIDWHCNGDRPRASIRFPCERPRGFAEVARDYIERYRLPVLLSETNIGGSTTDRITWLKFMEQEAEKVAVFADFRGFCWFPSIDATDWDSLCTRANCTPSPIGIWSLSEDRVTRYCSELSDWYIRLARGEARSCDLPSHPFTSPLDRDLHGYRRLMQHTYIPQ